MKLTEKKRHDILNAAVEEFQVSGFHAARINRIAELASVSKRTLYRHFESKEVLFDAIVEIIVAETATLQPVDFQPGQPLEKQLLSAIRVYIKVITADSYIGLTRVMVSEFLRDQEKAERVFSRVEMHNNPVTHLISEAMNAGVLRTADAGYAAAQLLSLVKTFFFWPKFLIGRSVPDRKKGNELLQDSIAMFLGHWKR